MNLLPAERGLVLKDVTQIRNITQAISGSYGENPQATILRDASMDNISKNGGEVNRKFPLKKDSEGWELTEVQWEFFLGDLGGNGDADFSLRRGLAG